MRWTHWCQTRLPTLTRILENRQKAKRNRLPKHLRPIPLWPIGVQMVLNAGLGITLTNLMLDRDEYLSEFGPAIALVACLLLLIYTLISAVRLRRLHDQTRGQKWAKINLALMALAFFSWALSIVVYLPD
jgi:hypothetical protein